MQRKRTSGGKKKYKFEPKITPQEVPVPEIDTEVKTEEVVNIPKLPQRQKKNSPRRYITALEPGRGSARDHGIDSGVQDMVFGHENDPQNIVAVQREPFSFYKDTFFVMEFPDIENGEFVAYEDGSCAMVNDREKIAMHPLPESPLIAVEIDGDNINELGIARQSYAE